MMILTGIALAGGVPLVATWVAAVTNIHQRWTMDELEEWSNDLAHTVGPLCASLGCTEAPTVTYGSHRDTVTVCEAHDPMRAA